MSDDFIPISGDKNAKKRKHQDKSSSGHKSTNRDEKPKSLLKSESQCPKLKDRICKYLEANKYKVKENWGAQRANRKRIPLNFFEANNTQLGSTINYTSLIGERRPKTAVPSVEIKI